MASVVPQPQAESSKDPQPRLVTGSLDLLRRLERFSVAALPARESWELPGWLCLADDGGHVGRANAATPMPSDAPAPISAVAASYRRRGLPPLIRWTPEAPESTASQLATNRWGSAGEVLVMTRPLASPSNAVPGDPLPAAACDIELAAEASPAWRATYGSSYSEVEATVRVRLALAAPPEKRFAAARVDGLTAGVALGISRDGMIGLFDIMVEPRFRRRGMASRLIGALEAWGADAGAELAFLQVAAANDPAVALYQRLGFEVAYSYVYAGPELGSAAGAVAD